MKKGLFIGCGIIIVIVVAIILLPNLTSKKLVCKSDEGNITIRYNEKKLVGYSAKKLSFDLKGQQSIVDKIGIEEYIKEFDAWFKANTTGSCK